MEFPPLVGQVLRRRVRRLRVEPHTTSPEPPGIGDKLSVDGQVVISRRVLSGRFEPPRVVLGVHVDRLPAPGVHLRTSSAQLLQWMKWGEAEVGEALPWIRPGGCNSLRRTTCRLHNLYTTISGVATPFVARRAAYWAPVRRGAPVQHQLLQLQD